MIEQPPTTSVDSMLPVLLDRTADYISELGAEFARPVDDLRGLKTRLEEVRFHLAVLGHPILPAALVPLTSIPTLLRPGEQRGLTVFYRDERPAHDFAAVTDAELSALLSDFVTESGNPKNERGVRQVEVSHPAEVLQEGVVLIDTPGIGSTFTHNTETTLRFLPWIEPLLDSDPGRATRIVAWLAADLPATRQFRAALCGDWRRSGRPPLASSKPSCGRSCLSTRRRCSVSRPGWE